VRTNHTCRTGHTGPFPSDNKTIVRNSKPSALAHTSCTLPHEKVLMLTQGVQHAQQNVTDRREQANKNLCCPQNSCYKTFLSALVTCPSTESDIRRQRRLRRYQAHEYISSFCGERAQEYSTCTELKTTCLVPYGMEVAPQLSPAMICWVNVRVASPTDAKALWQRGH